MRKTLSSNRHGGFTLMEMAIVLVIIGLLIGGIVKGQELVDSAKVKNLAADFRNVPLFLYAYQDKFRALPGDDAKANDHVGGANNASTPAGMLGNGVIDGNWDSTTPSDETFLFWQHVRLAGLTNGPTNVEAVTNPATAQAFLPKNADGGQVGIESGRAHFIQDVDSDAYLSGTFVICSAGILGKYAKQLDVMLDDGNARTGSLRIVDMEHNRGTPAEHANSALESGEPYIVCMGI